MEEIKTNTVDKTEDKTAKAKFAGEADILTRATVGDARIYVARTTRLVRKLSLRHKASHLATAALGRTVTGALLLAATMKNEEGVPSQYPTAPDCSLIGTRVPLSRWDSRISGTC